MKDFREFLLRGNLVDMAVGIVIGVAFAAVVTALVADLVTPLIAAIGGQPDFASLKFRINGSQFLYGAFINALITFVEANGRTTVTILVQASNKIARDAIIDSGMEAGLQDALDLLEQVAVSLG